jgi:hypothetical protein
VRPGGICRSTYLDGLFWGGLQSDVVQELLKAQGASKDGVLHWDVNQFNKYAIGKKRPYSVMFFFTAKHLLSKSNLGLKKLRVEFGYLAKAAIKKTGANGQVHPSPYKYSLREASCPRSQPPLMGAPAQGSAVHVGKPAH